MYLALRSKSQRFPAMNFEHLVSSSSLEANFTEAPLTAPNGVGLEYSLSHISLIVLPVIPHQDQITTCSTTSPTLREIIMHIANSLEMFDRCMSTIASKCNTTIEIRRLHLLQTMVLIY
jgi:hypothetical protein